MDLNPQTNSTRWSRPSTRFLTDQLPARCRSGQRAGRLRSGPVGRALRVGRPHHRRRPRSWAEEERRCWTWSWSASRSAASWPRCPSSRARWPPGSWPRAGDPGSACLDALIAEPSTVSTVALRPAVDGTAKLVPSGSIAGVVVAMDADELVVVADLTDGSRRRAISGRSPLADRSVRVPDRSVLATGDIARAAHEQARRRMAHADEWCAGRPGRGGPRPRGRVRQGPPPVRRAHRILPVDRPRSGRCGHPGGRGPSPGPRGGMGADRRRSGFRARWPRWPSSSPPGPPDGPATWRSTCTAATDSPSSTTSSSTTAGPRRGRSASVTRGEGVAHLADALFGPAEAA